MEIKIYRKHIYGNELTLYVDQEIGSAMFELTQKRTLTDRIRKSMEKLGFTFIEVLPPK
jgi:hypothetical protein